MLDITWKDGSLRNDVDILDSILNVCVQCEWFLCELLSDEIIVDKENIRSVICGVD
jgi:hypothetical protein